MRKRLLRRKSLCLILFFALVGGISPDGRAEETLGESGAAYLKLGMGSRTRGMGGAGTAAALDASALYWNPALMAELDRPEFLSGSVIMNEDRSYSFASLTWPFQKDVDQTFEALSNQDRTVLRRIEDKKRYAVSLGILSMGVSKIEGRDTFGAVTNSFDDQETALLFGYSMNVYEDLFMGITVESLTQKLDTAKASGMGFGMGFSWHSPSKQWRGGLSVRDVGASLKWKVPDDLTQTNIRYTETLPSCLSAGVSYSSADERWMINVDGRRTGDQDIRGYAGAEYRTSPFLALRIGCNAYNPTAGIGLILPWSWLDLSVDYAYQYDLKEFDNPHWITLSARFGRVPTE
ncbi:MAG TPA: PorV/PorQ family protein [Elusimicrobiota bacterium]|nr:PorV/PorQ family protein [Elusimicrobiota bacterium]